MSAKEDIESNEEIKETSVLTLKNVLIVLGSLTVIAALGFGVLHVASGSRVQSQAQTETGSDGVKLMVFHFKENVYKLNPLNRELIAEPVFKRSSEDMAGNYLKLSDDKTKIYSWGNEGLHVYDSRSYLRREVDVKLPGYCPLFVDADKKIYYNVGLISNKAGSTSVVYPAQIKDSKDYLIRHYNLDRKKPIGDYESQCTDKRILSVLGQSNDGSKIFYQCGEGSVYKKDMDNPEEQDQFMFKAIPNNKMFILPGESKAIVYGDHQLYWKIVDLNNPEADEKVINFNTNVYGVASILLSDNQATLYVLLDLSGPFFGETEIKLFELSVDSLLKYESFSLLQIESGGREVELSSNKN